MAFLAVGAYEERGLHGGQGSDVRARPRHTGGGLWGRGGHWTAVQTTVWFVCGLCVEARCSSTSSVVRLGHGILGRLGYSRRRCAGWVGPDL